MPYSTFAPTLCRREFEHAIVIIVHCILCIYNRIIIGRPVVYI
jgi:hypothetical protein